MKNEERFDETTRQQTMLKPGVSETKTFVCALSWRRKALERQTMTSFIHWQKGQALKTLHAIKQPRCSSSWKPFKSIVELDSLQTWTDTVLMHFVTSAKSRAANGGDEMCWTSIFLLLPLLSDLALIIRKENGLKLCLLSDKKNEARKKTQRAPHLRWIVAPISQTCENNSSW